MKIYIPLLLIHLVWLTTSCQEETLRTNTPEEVQLQVMTAGKQTDSRVTMDKNEFETTDKFRFFFNSSEPTSDPAGTNTILGVGDAVIKVADYSYIGSDKWTTTTTIYWDDQEKKVGRLFCGVMPFPYTGNKYKVTDHTFTIAKDQSSATGVDYKASDLMIARTKTDKRLIPLKFWHALSRVVVNVTVSIDDTNPDNCFAEDALDGIAINLYNIYTIATIDYATEPTPDTGATPEYNPAIAVGVNTSTQTNVKMYQTKTSKKDDTKKELTTSHVAVIPPQDIAADTKVLVITLKEDGTEKNYYFKHNAITTFVQHKETEINVTLYKTKVEATGTIDIKSWGEIKAEGGGTIVLPK